MIEYRAARFRLYPTPEQYAKMAQFAGACRFVYNLALEQRSKWWRPGRKFNFASQCRELTVLRAENDWLRDVSVQPLQQALRDLDKAYQGFWSGRKGYPGPRKKGINESFRFPEPRHLEVERTGKSSGRIKLPKLGWVPLRGWRDLQGDICNVTVSYKSDKWFASVECRREVEEPMPSVLPVVGIDMGISVFASLSDGTTIDPVYLRQKAQPALRKAQRNLSRKKKGSNNRRKAQRRLARMHQWVANARKDFIHKQTTTIANSHSMVVVEALNITNMSASATGNMVKPGRNVAQKTGLNRAIRDQGWGMFRVMLGWKLAERGGQLVRVNPAYTSQACFECGVIDARNRVSQSCFICTGCGHEANADTNAAKNILQRGLGESLKPVEGHRIKRPCEAGSIWRAA